MAEFVAVCLKKSVLPENEMQQAASDYLNMLRFVSVCQVTIRQALELRERYALSLWDSLLLSSALEANCSVLYTEDLQHGQVIEGTLRIVNPFAPAT